MVVYNLVEKLKIPAYAKINLFLKVKNLRDDGYHNLEMVMQSIKLHDNIVISAKESDIKIASNSNEIPLDSTNLAYKAAKAVINKVRLDSGVSIYIEKNIPIAAGLAGGSTDAASVITGINKYFDLNLSKAQMYQIAKSVGSDVPFCLTGGTAFVTGRGEIVKKINPIKKQKILLVKPKQKVSTKKIYKLYDEYNINKNIPTNKLLSIIKSNKKLLIKDGWANELEDITNKLIPEVKRIKQLLINKSLDFTMMTGSGPTVYSLLDKKQERIAFEIVNNWPCESDFITITETKDL